MGHRQYCASIIGAICFWSAGCSSTVHEMVIRDELSAWTNETIVEITLNNGSVIRFDGNGGRLNWKQEGQMTTSSIVGHTRDNVQVQVDLEKVVGAKIERLEFSAGRTLLLTLTLTAGVSVTLLLIALSSI